MATGVSSSRSIIAALARALPLLFSARIAAVIVLPLVAAALLWSVAGWFLWTPLAHWIDATLFGAVYGWSYAGAAALAALVLMLGAVLTVLFAIAVLAMPVIVETVAARDFPTLVTARGGTAIGSVANALRTFAVFVPVWLAALVLMAVPPLYVAASLALNAWLNQRLFRYDALALHADRQELNAVMRHARGRLVALGLVLAPLSLVPLVNLVAPLYAGIAFTYLCLDELATLRARSSRR
jgi:CysZ protein